MRADGPDAQTTQDDARRHANSAQASACATRRRADPCLGHARPTVRRLRSTVSLLDLRTASSHSAAESLALRPFRDRYGRAELVQAALESFEPSGIVTGAADRRDRCGYDRRGEGTAALDRAARPAGVEVDGRPLEVDTRKATALLAYLAIEGHPVRRDTIASLLWPENDPERARSALRRTLSTLRSALGGRWLETDRDLVSLGGAGHPARRRRAAPARSPSARRTGTGRARRARAASSRCARRSRSTAGRSSAGFGLRDSAAFDDWQQLTTDVAAARGRAARSTGSPTRSRRPATARARSRAARRRLALDPLHEPAHRQLIRVYAASGDRSAALEQYRECVRVLDRELGVRPLDETTALYHAVLEGTYAPEPAAPPPAPRRGPEPRVARSSAATASSRR